MAGGRPSIFTEELSQEIIRRIADGESVNAIMSSDDMPESSTFYKWRIENEEFSEKCAHAIEQRAINISQEMLAIADETSIGADNSELQRARLRIDARDKYLARMAPRKYEIGGDGKRPIKTEQSIVFIPVGKND
jgi:hypothetical protein